MARCQHGKVSPRRSGFRARLVVGKHGREIRTQEWRHACKGVWPGYVPNAQEHTETDTILALAMAVPVMVARYERPLPPSRNLLGHLNCLGLHFFQAAHHIEGHLGQVVTVALEQLGEALDGLFQFDKPPGLASKHFSHSKGLR